MDTGLIVTKGKIELKTDGMLKKIQGRMTVKINDQCFENIGVLWDTGCTDSGIDTSLFEKLLNLEKDWSTISTASGHTNTEYVVTSIEIAGIKLEGIRLVKTSNCRDKTRRDSFGKNIKFKTNTRFRYVNWYGCDSKRSNGHSMFRI